MNIRRSIVRSCVGLVIAAGLFACASEKNEVKTPVAAEPVVMNTTCPYSTQAVNPDITADYKGKKIAFCCKGCWSRWENATDEQRAAMMAKMK
ncbi:MAG: hypothetical protein IT438_16950 [Phycisphaerales bacterium]|nr:hypothetical protein [Phycisphaerales bacterium]